jgi:hypothetical protein
MHAMQLEHECVALAWDSLRPVSMDYCCTTWPPCDVVSVSCTVPLILRMIHLSCTLAKWDINLASDSLILLCDKLV